MSWLVTVRQQWGGGWSDWNYCVYPFSENLFLSGLEWPSGNWFIFERSFVLLCGGGAGGVGLLVVLVIPVELTLHTFSSPDKVSLWTTWRRYRGT